jgi:hypothetical protein
MFGKSSAQFAKTNRAAAILWSTLSLAAFGSAIAVTPSLIPAKLPGNGEQFRAALVQGITLVRAGLVICGILAILSAFLLRPVAGAVAAPMRFGMVDVAIVGGLLGLTLLLTVPHLARSFWWDELITLVGLVKRGPMVILSFSADANNHIANSLLMWCVLHGMGESEFLMRLPALLFGLATPIVVYGALVGVWGRERAALTAFLAAVNSAAVAHAVEARGYSGAILFSFLACRTFMALLDRSSGRNLFLYVLFAVTSVGFIATTVLVPLSHGVVALILYLKSLRAGPGDTDARTPALNAVLACLWVAVVGTIMFGLIAPQMVLYAAKGAPRDHSPLGWPILGDIAKYLGSIPTAAGAGLVLALAVAGWALNWRERSLCLAYLPPAAAAVVHVCLPGSYVSPRFFCYLIVPVAMGLATLILHLFALRRLPRLAAAIVLLGWLGLVTMVHWDLLTGNHVDLRRMAANLSPNPVVLFGPQADMNAYYFRDAQIIVRIKPKSQDFRDAVYVVESRESAGEPDPMLLALGFAFVERQDSRLQCGMNYFVYRRQEGSQK